MSLKRQVAATLLLSIRYTEEFKPQQTIDLVVELNNEDTKRKKLQVFKNVSFDSRAITVFSGIAYFVMTQNRRLSLRF